MCRLCLKQRSAAFYKSWAIFSRKTCSHLFQNSCSSQHKNTILGQKCDEISNSGALGMRSYYIKSLVVNF